MRSLPYPSRAEESQIKASQAYKDAWELAKSKGFTATSIDRLHRKIVRELWQKKS